MNGKTPCIRYGELYTHYGEVIYSIFSSTNLPASGLFLSRKNDVIIPSSGETKLDIATVSCVMCDDIALGGDLNVIRTGINGIFLSYYLNGPKKNNIAKIAQGDTVAHLYSSQLEQLETAIPKSFEQQKIADCLSSLDELITAHAQKLVTLKAHKKGLMQQLFPAEGKTLPNLRFPEFRDAGKWSVRVFREIISRSFYGTSCATSDIGAYPVLRMGNMVDGRIDIRSLTFIDLSEEDFRKFELKYGDILLNRTNSIELVGKISLFNLNGKYVASSYLVAYRLRFELIDPKFCNYLLNSGVYQCRIKGLATRAVCQANINPTVFQEKLIITIPPTNEQQKIADCLSSLDELIAAQTQKLGTLKAHKKGLMQQLFPSTEGEIQV